jgi:hypothetical protein
MTFPQRWCPLRTLLFAFLIIPATVMPGFSATRSAPGENANASIGAKATTTYDPAKNVADIVATNMSIKDDNTGGHSREIILSRQIPDHPVEHYRKSTRGLRRSHD